MLLATLVLAGCAYTPQMMTRVDDFNVCRLATSPTQQRDVANAEIARRDVDCTPYYQQIAEDKRANAAAAWEALGTMPAYQPSVPAYMPPRSINCTSSRVGGTVFTTCD